jgi:hypothetical protein
MFKKSKKSKKRESEDLYKAHYCTKIVGVMIIFALMLNVVSALELNPFADKKIYEPILKEDTNDFLKESFNEDYGIIRLSKTLFWIETDKIAEYSLIENTEQCLVNCEARGKATLYQSGQLFEDLRFLGVKGTEKDLLNAKYLIKEIETYEVEVPGEFKEVCVDVIGNLTKEGETSKNCFDEVVSYKKESREREVWNEYKGQILAPGDYEWKVTANKRPTERVDFIPVARGKTFNEWAWWDSSWEKKKEITINNTNSDYLYVKIEYNLNMKSDFSDLRFLNSSENEELTYWLEDKVDSSFAIIRIKTNNESLIYMYYNNSLASSNSDIKSVYGDDLTRMYNFDEKGGTTLIEKGFGVLNGTIIGTPSFNQTGIFNNTYGLPLSPYIDLSSTMLNSANGSTYSFWFKHTGATPVGIIDGTWNGLTVFLESDSKIKIRNTALATEFTYGEWTHVVVIFNTTSAILYKNGVYIGQDANSKFPSSNLLYSIGAHSDGGNRYYLINGSIDDVLIFNNTISSDMAYSLYTTRNNDVTFGAEGVIEEVSVSLTNPDNAFETNSQTIDFNATITPTNTNITNVTWKAGAQEDFQTYNTNDPLDLNWTKTLADGEYSWNVTACWIGVSETHSCTESATRTLEIDTIDPSIVINYGNGTFNYGNLNINHTINFTVTDINLDSCWVEYNETNSSDLGCSSGVLEEYNFPLDEDVYNATVWANDTFGNLNSEFLEWNYNIFENNINFEEQSYETSINNYSINVTSDSNLESANLIYGDESYSTTKTILGDEYIFTSEINSPLVSEDTNYTFYWNFTYDEDVISSTERGHLVKNWNMTLDNTHQLINVSIYDEETGDFINSTTLNVLLDYYLGDGTNSLIYSDSQEEDGLYNIGSSYSDINNIITDLQFSYNALGYPQREYYNDFILTNSIIQQIDLYLLLSDAGIINLFEVYDGLNELSDVSIKATKIEGSTETLVDSALTDDNGQGILFLDSNYPHEIVFTKSGCTSVTKTIYPTGGTEEIQMDCGADEAGIEHNITVQEGLSISFLPSNAHLTNGTTEFIVYVSDDYCAISNILFTLLIDGVVVNSTSSTESCGDTLSLIRNLDDGEVTSRVVVTKNSTDITQTKVYYVTNIGNLTEMDKSLFDILNELQDQDFFGLSNNSKTFIAFIIIFLIIGSLSMIEGIKSDSLGTLFFVWVMIFMFSFIGWFNLGLIESTSAYATFLNKYALTILSGLILGGVVLLKTER